MKVQAKNLTTLARETRYQREAFEFVDRGLAHTVEYIHGPLANDDDLIDRHISGEDLCLGLRSFAIEQYGLLARQVLRHWNINSTEDFGHIVFAMVEAGRMQKTDDDSIEDFCNIFSFEDAFKADLVLTDKV